MSTQVSPPPPSSAAHAAAAWLLHGRAGLGKWALLRTLADALLCEQPLATGGPDFAALPPSWRARRACGHCPSCALLRSGTHPDLFVAVPDALRTSLGLTAAESVEKTESKTLSADIRIDTIRALSDWAERTSHRGGLKVALVYPADALNPAASNALLKTLEEPPPGVQFLLGAHRLDAVWPTVRSRCRLAAMPRPDAQPARAGLPAGVDGDAVLAWAQFAVQGADPAAGLDWARAVLAAATGPDVTAERPPDWPAPPDYATAITALQRLLADVQRVQAGGAPIYLPGHAAQLQRLAARLPTAQVTAFLPRLAQRRALAQFPLNQPLAIDALLLEFSQLFATATDPVW